MNQEVYDYAIIGAGAAGLQLVLAMVSDPWFRDKSILILDADEKNQDDHTWCYWEKGEGKWDQLISHQWARGVFETSRKKIELNLPPYNYKMLRSIDFYNYALEKIEMAGQVTWHKKRVSEVKDEQPKILKTDGLSFLAHQIFDSRIDKGHLKKTDKAVELIQHFLGWEIETPEPRFDESRFVMMDYRIKYEDSTSFTYVLPTTPHKALVEFTFFNKSLVSKQDYEELLRRYIKEVLKIDNYKITKIEGGQIPMSSFPFHEAGKKGIDKIGTAGSWVKPSSGYAFKNIERCVEKLVENLKSGRPPSDNLLSSKFRFYDHLFLDVFSEENELGELVFEDMYTKNSIQSIFKFLDEETSWPEDLRIIKSIRPRPFLRALRRYIFKF